MSLTPTQHQIQTAIISELNEVRNLDGYNPITLAGFAGTGKTFLVGKLIETLKAHGYHVGVAAPTHKACKVLKSKMKPGTEVNTVHRLFYERPSDKMVRYLHTYNTSPDKGQVQKARAALEKIRGQSDMSFENVHKWKHDYDVIIVDESSMLPEDMVATAAELGLTIIYVGDGGQLPPVEGRAGVDLSNADYTLTEIIRTKDGSPIPFVAGEIRKAKDTHELWGILDRAKSGYPDVFSNLPDPDGMNLCWTNKTRRMINDFYRGKQPMIKAGDEFLIHKGAGSLVIGDTVKIMMIKDEPVDGNLFLRDVVLKDERDITHRTTISLTDIDPKGTQKRYGVKAAEANYDTMKRTPRSVVAYPHCITVHKSQGSQFRHVNLNIEGILNSKLPFDNIKRWLYTGMTRTEETVTIL